MGDDDNAGCVLFIVLMVALAVIGFLCVKDLSANAGKDPFPNETDCRERGGEYAYQKGSDMCFKDGVPIKIYTNS